ncbi:hypothetical protein HYH03_003379 [Edaphochlamys debaryana]|uniref:Uncharacterized protein n=1 Tax=Edaphochlamys debaryana TaxID=47281 RepID=A0A835Y978_9CHLO|nr:hypothetical protein HYH03_003379 [Edaphochlamys debaryana]|eukprot:KAG2498632.1 hypothetical protein HYH03_003379 [Edaphochlamys debaryana]
MGASPFCVLATTPELPTSSIASTSARSPAPGRGGAQTFITFRRQNSSKGQLTSRPSGSAPSGVPATPAGARKPRSALVRAALALLAVQIILGVLILSQPAWRHGAAALMSSPTRSFAFHPSSWAPLSKRTGGGGGSSTLDVVSALGAKSRSGFGSGSSKGATNIVAIMAEKSRQREQKEYASRKEHMWDPPKAQAVTAKASSTSQPVVLSASVEAEAALKKTKPAAAVNTGTTAAAGAVAAAAAGSGSSAVVVQQASDAAYPPFVKPVVPFPGRVANPPPIVGVVFYGRRSRVRILDCYLQRNMKRNGGLLTSVVFVTATWDAADVAFLDRLVKLRSPEYSKLYPKRLDKGYTGHYAWMDPGTMYVKIDDDVVFIEDHAIDQMLIAHNLHRYHLISANVVNHQPLELPHSQSGAHTTYEQTVPGDKTSWRPVMKAAPVDPSEPDAKRPVVPVPFMDNGWDVWGNWSKAASVHYSFLANAEAGQLEKYRFPNNERLWDFNRHFGYTRWRINMIMFKGATIDVHVYNMSSTVGTYPGDDEDFITRILPQQLNRTSAAVSEALAVHFSFFMQRAGLENSTDLLDRYALLAEKTCGRLALPEVPK